MVEPECDLAVENNPRFRDMFIGLAKDEEEMELFLEELMALPRVWEYLRLGTLGLVSSTAG